MSSFELIITHTLPSVIKTAVTAILILLGTFFYRLEARIIRVFSIAYRISYVDMGQQIDRKIRGKKRNLNSKMISIILEYIQGMKAFKSANMTSEHFERMINTLENVRKTSVNAEKENGVTYKYVLYHS